MDGVSMNLLVLLFSVCMLCILLGVYLISYLPKQTIGWVYLILCLAVALWAFGLALSIHAPEYRTSFTWKRVSILGSGAIYSLLLHVTLLLTDCKNVLKRWGSYLLIYAPALVPALVFVIPDKKLATHLILVHRSFGWEGALADGFLKNFFMLYGVLFSIIILFVLLKYRKKLQEEKHRRRAMILAGSVVAALILRAVSDLTVIWLHIDMPNLAPAYNLIPITAAFFAICYKMLNVSDGSIRNEPILRGTDRTKVINYLAIAYLAGGVLDFITQLGILHAKGLAPTLVPSILIAMVGVLVALLNRIQIYEWSKDFILVVLLNMSVLLVTMRYLQFASVTIWAFPFILLTVALLFNNRMHLVALSVSTLLTQIMVWVAIPRTNVPVDEADYLGRIGLFCIAIWAAFYVNKIVVARLMESTKKTRNQTILSELSSDFVMAGSSNINEKLDSVMEKIGELLSLDRVCIYTLNLEENTLAYTFEWCRKGVATMMDSFREMPIPAFPWWMGQSGTEGIVHIPDVTKLPIEAENERMFLENRNTGMMLSIPIDKKGKVMGFLGCESMTPGFAVSADDQELLKIMCNILADAFMKVDAENEINFMAYYDQLTRLPNRVLFRDRVEQAILQSVRTSKGLGVILLDLDSFKSVNDTVGHESGDEIICMVAQRLQTCVRRSDTVSRFGGDEFLLLLTNLASTEDMALIADNVIKRFNLPIHMGGNNFHITLSAGIAVYPEDGTDAKTLIKNADIALYTAKEKGKNQYALCSLEMKREVERNIQITNLLHHALERQELYLLYQPQISLHTGKIVGVEALLRWNSTELGMVPPVVFIPIAEQIGIIDGIGEWVMRTACRQSMMWQDMGLEPIVMAVNVSVNQFRNPQLPELVTSILWDTGLAPEYLELEITESQIIQEFDQVIDMLGRLKQMGIAIAIDDFGTKYSSLSRLKMLPIDRLKIDRQFVMNLESSEKDKAIIKTIITLAANLNLKVIAEGVETEEQINQLKQLSCHEVQGYYYHRPISPEEIRVLLSEKE